MLTELESSMEVSQNYFKPDEFEIDFESVYKKFSESKVINSKLDEEIIRIFSNYRN